MRTAQIIIDTIALITFTVGLIMGKEECSTWVAIIWTAIALLAHIMLKKYEDNH